MKKFLLLACTILCAGSIKNAEAMHWKLGHNELMPYIGAEYVYSKAKQGALARNFKDNFNSGKADLGVQIMENYYMEFSFQMSGELKNRRGYEDRSVKNYLSVYAMDLYGKYPILCSDFSVLGTIGTAINHVEYKGLPNKSFNRVGYRGGIGMQYDFNEYLAARAVGRYSYIGADRMNNLKEVTVGMLMRF